LGTLDSHMKYMCNIPKCELSHVDAVPPEDKYRSGYEVLE